MDGGIVKKLGALSLVAVLAGLGTACAAATPEGDEESTPQTGEGVDDGKQEAEGSDVRVKVESNIEEKTLCCYVTSDAVICYHRAGKCLSKVLTP